MPTPSFCRHRLIGRELIVCPEEFNRSSFTDTYVCVKRVAAADDAFSYKIGHAEGLASSRDAFPAYAPSFLRLVLADPSIESLEITERKIAILYYEAPEMVDELVLEHIDRIFGTGGLAIEDELVAA